MQLAATCESHMKKDIFGISAVGVELSRTRKKLVATASRREGVYKRTGEPSVTFCEKEEQGSGRMAYFLSQTKNKPEQSELCSDVVEPRGVEPLTSAMRTQRSTI